ncbi:uncharacterized protein [Nicotiana tomentosiformis]|uniref:uncharacterized protein n=1 Tax=Nicotiana tomentosiformis TaxID=4098 RepID=UPI00388CB523
MIYWIITVDETVNAIPVWVVFPHLPIQYWATENLGRIASCLGKPICTDKLTAKEGRISYARVLIEMDVSQPLPDSVMIEEPDGSCKLQPLEYELKPDYCQECVQIGSHKESCKAQVKAKLTTIDKQQPRKPQKKVQQQQWKAKTTINPPTNHTTLAYDKSKEANYKEVTTYIEKIPAAHRPSKDRGKKKNG